MSTFPTRSRIGTGRFHGPAVSSALLALLFALASLAPAPVQAQSCWIDQGLDFAFGTVNSSGKSTSDTLVVTCNREGGPPALAYRICLFIPEGFPVPGINPRWMTNYNGANMAYDLHADPAGTQPIPSSPDSGGASLYSTVLRVQANTTGAQGQVLMPVYATVRPGQNLPATHGFQSQINGGRIRYVYNGGVPGNPPVVPAPEQCLTGAAREVGFYTHVSASFANSCRISTATDMDFGAVTSVTGNRDQTSTIQLQCPVATGWRVGRNDGSHADGNVRRMAGPQGRYLHYELYRDPQRTMRWGNSPGTDTSDGTGTDATQTLTVYGRVPAQPTPVPGNYADTVTITLTY